MGSVRVRKESGYLFLDFRYQGQRCREQTLLTDNKANRKKLNQVLVRIEQSIEKGGFDYAAFFPNSKNVHKFVAGDSQQVEQHINLGSINSNQVEPHSSRVMDENNIPDFTEFSKTWMAENEVAWRQSHRENQQSILDSHLIAQFGGDKVSRITKAEILSYRASLAKVAGRKGKGLSPKRINTIMALLRQILDEAADRFNFITPYTNIKPLKVPRTHVEPFTMEEVHKVLDTVRNDYRDYYLVRFFTGLRTGEIDGLKWEFVDFTKREILIRQTLVKGREEYTKNDGSQREVQMSEPVFEALQRQFERTRHKSQFVFCNGKGEPLDHNNVTKRVWYPILRYLELKPRRPYQTRHTAATLWLAAGESPEWIARQMGHSSTEMLFRVYSRYVPNLTRQDGSAFERLLRANQFSCADQGGKTYVS